MIVVVWKGPGESGKSTLFKQMKVLYGVGFTAEEIANFTLVVHHNIISAMRALVQACEDFDHEIQCYVRDCLRFIWLLSAFFTDNGKIPFLFRVFQDELEQFREISDQVIIDKEVGAILKVLWADTGVQSAFAARNTFQLHDSTA
jgi:G-protein alpha subunit